MQVRLYIMHDLTPHVRTLSDTYFYKGAFIGACFGTLKLGTFFLHPKQDSNRHLRGMIMPCCALHNYPRTASRTGEFQ